MKYLIFMKKLHLFLFITILINKIFITAEGNCILKKFKRNEIQRMKCKSVSTGYNICVETKGIYSFNSLLTKTLYYYDFSSIITIGDSFVLGKVVIEELKTSDKKNSIILCFLSPSYLFVLSYRGEFIFFDQFENQFKINNYCGIFLCNYINSTKDYNYVILYTQGFRAFMYQYSLNLDKESNEFKASIYYDTANDAGTSCELLLDNLQRNVLVCFMVIYSEGKKFSAISFLTDQNLEHLSTNTFTLDQDLVDNIKLIRTSSYDKKRVLVSLIDERESKLAIYNIIYNTLSQFISSIEGCNPYYYSINLYYFDNSEEFVFSCIDSELKYLKMIPITKDFTIKENNKFEKYEFEGNSNIEILSILFIKPLNIYNTIVITSCCDYNYLSYNYLLIEDDSNCNNIIQNIQQLNETYNEESIDDEQNPLILETSQSKVTSQITEKLTSQNEITKTAFPNVNTEYNQISESTQNLLETNGLIISGEILETNNAINISKIEQTNYAMKSNEISESNQIIETSRQILGSDKSIEDSSQFEESQSFKSTEIIESSQVEESQSFKSNENIGNSQVEDSQSIKSNEIEIIESSQVDKLNNISDYSKIPENNQTTEISELPEATQIIFSTEIKESSNIYNTEEITNKLTYDNDSIKINELTQKIFSNKITESEKLTESRIVTDNTKTELSNIKETDKINKVTENIKTEGVIDTPICEEKCSKCNEDSNLKSLCIECNEEKQYFKIIINSNIDGLLNGDYKECIKEESKPKNYYFNETERAFKPCYYTCETCSRNGDSNDHNCTTCVKNYIFNINKNNNCILGCKYYFYFSIIKSINAQLIINVQKKQVF